MHFYERYPMMKPYEGKYFRDATKPSVLLVGESHYLPVESSQHETPGKWYRGDSTSLSQTEIDWISTAQLIEGSRAERFSNKAHSIWKNSFQEINRRGLNYTDYTRVADDIAFCNFFLRPGCAGESLDVMEEDIEVANRTFAQLHEELRPTMIVFLSTLAHSHFQLPSRVAVPVVATPHPGCQWWNRVAKKYGDKTGREVLGDCIANANWPKA